MGRQAWNACPLTEAFDQMIGGIVAQATAACANKHGRFTIDAKLLAQQQVFPQRAVRRRPKGYLPVLLAFATHAHLKSLPIHILEVEADQFVEAHTAIVKDRQHRVHTGPKNVLVLISANKRSTSATDSTCLARFSSVGGFNRSIGLVLRYPSSVHHPKKARIARA